jgi:hypothetical protein
MNIITRACVIGITWPLLIFFHLTMLLLGIFLMVPLGLLYSKLNNGINTWPRFLQLWNVDTVNGYIPDWWYNDLEDGAPSHWFSAKFPNYYYLAIRNPSNSVRHWIKEPEYETWGDEYMESKDGLQFQYRRGGFWMDMFRWTFGPVNPKMGKNEILLGWKLMDNIRGVDFTTQFRPSWLGIIPGLLVLWGYILVWIQIFKWIF